MPGGFCGIAYDTDSARIWAYDCDVAVIYEYTTAGVFVRSIPMAGETANDVDLSMTPTAISMAGTPVPTGRLLVINGETATAEVHAVAQGPGTVLATLNTAFGAAHVVGGAYNAVRNSFYLVQDDVPAAALDNLIAEVDATTGAVLNQFDLVSTFNVGYGDLEVSQVTGHLFLVSGDETTIIQYSPTGTLIQEYPLPAGVGSLSGLALDCVHGEAWLASTSGIIYHVGGFPCSTTAGENNSLSCADGVDNDLDGLTDCEDPACQALNDNLGCLTCFSDGLSFAEQVLAYSNNCAGNIATNPAEALGMPD